MTTTTRRPPARRKAQDDASSTNLARPADWAREQIDLVKRTVARGATDDELALFLYQCRRLGLDPMSRQIYFVKRWDAREQREVGVIQVGIDGLRLIAARTGRYRPDEEPPRITYDDTGQVRAARVRVWVYHAPTQAWHPVEAEAHYDEYVQRGRDGSPIANWARMPRLMTAKCAEALALRKAFPAELSGVYEFAEIGGPVEPQDVPVSTPQAELPLAMEDHATPQQREAVHRVWHARTRGVFPHREAVEQALDAWLRAYAGVRSTTQLTFQQAAQALRVLQETPVDELVAVATDALKEAAHAS